MKGVFTVKKFAVLLISAMMITAAASVSFAGATVTTGAGYKTMLEALCAAFRESGGAVEEMYGGHIGMMLEQIKQGSGVNIVVSDKGSLDAMSAGVEFDSYEPLGDTLLVLAWRKGIEIKTPEDLTKPEIKSVAYPDAKAAIYGRAATKFLESSGIGAKIQDKVSEVSSVPQVFAYLVSGEMDAGFVNRVMIMNGADKNGGSLEIASGYPSLNMVAGVVKGAGSDPDVAKFVEFLRSPVANEILKKNGVW
jgi:molybdate transport system substrate-binding protein